MNRNTREYSPQNRKGIFTSKNLQQKPSVIPYLDSSLQGLKQGIESLKGIGHYTVSQNQTQRNMTNTAAFPQHPIHHQNQNQNLNISNLSPIGSQQNITIQQARRSITPTKINFNHPPIYHPPPHPHHPQAQGQSIQYIPIERDTVHMDGNVQIRKKFVPVHYYNHVPARILVNPAQQQQQNQTNYVQVQGNNDEAYQVLLKQYEKVFNRLSKEQGECEQLRLALKRAEEELANSYQRSNNQEKEHVETNSKLQLNLQELHNQFSRLYTELVNKVIKKRKQSAKNRITDLFANATRQIGFSVHQQIDRSYNYSKR